MNARIGNIAPQWNVTFNDWFSTTAANGTDLPDFDANEWSKMFGTSTHCTPFDKDCVEDFDGGIPKHKQRKNNNNLQEEVIPQDMQAEDSLLEPTQVFGKRKVKSQTTLILKHKLSPQPDP